MRAAEKIRVISVREHSIGGLFSFERAKRPLRRCNHGVANRGAISLQEPINRAFGQLKRTDRLGPARDRGDALRRQPHHR